MYQRLSYNLAASDPGWPGNPKVSVEPYSQIKDGADANTSSITLFNHFGSHMDGPKHFNDNGPSLYELPLDNFIYEKPVLIDIPKSFGEFVTVDELRKHANELKGADLLLIRSNFSKERRVNPNCYASEGPGIKADACKYLMDEFPNLKAIALDWISLASYTNSEEGVLAHQYLLGCFHDHYICIIEDLNFEKLEPSKLKRVFSLPLMVEGIDSAPVNVVAEISE